MTIRASPRRRSWRSRAVEGSRRRIDAISDLNCSTRSGAASMVVLILSSPEIRRAQLERDLFRLALHGDPAVRHDRRLVRHAQDDLGELLDDEDRDAFACDAR